MIACVPVVWFPKVVYECPVEFCIVLKKVYTFWLIILILVYKLKSILNTIYTLLFLRGWIKRKQALLRSNLPGITPVCDEVYRSESQVLSWFFYIYFGTPNALKKPKPALAVPPFSFYWFDNCFSITLVYLPFVGVPQMALSC